VPGGAGFECILSFSIASKLNSRAYRKPTRDPPSLPPPLQLPHPEYRSLPLGENGKEEGEKANKKVKKGRQKKI
jgi:hypothetical protein